MKKAPAPFRFAAMAVDAVVFAIVDDTLMVLVSDVNADSPYHGLDAFPGGIMYETETADDTLVRVLNDKSKLSAAYYEQLYTFSAIDRDARNRVVSVAYLCCVRPDTAATYAHSTARFVPAAKVGKLGYDHNEILKVARKRLAGKLAYTTIAQYLLPRHFTLTELQTSYELILNQELDKRNFRKKIIALDLVRDTGRVQEGVKNRPAALYEFKSQKIQELPLLI